MAPTDEALMNACRNGERDAFEEVVRRYQGFVASVAYSATGDLTLSEDITQQAFVAAWQEVNKLRDPGRLSSWLAGIARNLIRRDYRTKQREAAARANAALNALIQEPTPLEQAINQEQQHMLWSILEQIPPNYREPLILYYREQRSVAEVARLLQLSEDAVKQRLARGRNMIRDEMTRFVEETLSQTRPGARFTGAVLAALPSGGGAAGAATGAIAAKLASFMTAAFIGPIIGIAGAAMGIWNTLRQATSRTERQFYWTYLSLSLLIIVVELGTVLTLVLCFRPLLTSVAFWVSVGFLYTISIFVLVIIGNRLVMKIKLKHGTAEEKHDIQQYGTIQIPIRKAMPPWFPEHIWLLTTIVVPIIVVSIFATVARDWVGASFLAFAAAILIAIFWRPAKNAQDAKSQSKLFLVMMWAGALIGAGAMLIRGDYWVISLMPQVADRFPEWIRLILIINATFFLLLALLITVGQRLSRIKPKNTRAED